MRIQFPAPLMMAVLLTSCPPASTPTASALRITYDGNGYTEGNVPSDPNTYQPGQTATVLGNSGLLKKINVSGISFRFTNWNSQPDGNGFNYAAGTGQLVMGSADVVLYAHWIQYSKRDVGPAGGWVFYDKSDYSNGWRYLEAASTDQTVGISWGSYGTNISGADSTAVGMGVSNTLDIYLELGTNASYAARLCLELTQGGYTDWFLPSKVELYNIYNELHAFGVGGFINNYYWSSSESDSSNAWALYFLTGAQNIRPKNSSYKVRAIRAF